MQTLEPRPSSTKEQKHFHQEHLVTSVWAPRTRARPCRSAPAAGGVRGGPGTAGPSTGAKAHIRALRIAPGFRALRRLGQGIPPRVTPPRLMLLTYFTAQHDETPDSQNRRTDSVGKDLRDHRVQPKSGPGPALCAHLAPHRPRGAASCRHTAPRKGAWPGRRDRAALPAVPALPPGLSVRGLGKGSRQGCAAAAPTPGT